MNFEWSKFSYFDTSADSLYVHIKFGSSATIGGDSVWLDVVWVSFSSVAIPASKQNAYLSSYLPMKLYCIVVSDFSRIYYPIAGDR